MFARNSHPDQREAQRLRSEEAQQSHEDFMLKHTGFSANQPVRLDYASQLFQMAAATARAQNKAIQESK
jgi:hypothetical protein